MAIDIQEDLEIRKNIIILLSIMIYAIINQLYTMFRLCWLKMYNHGGTKVTLFDRLVE